MTYTFHTDPGHGWLEVPMAELEALGIADQVTPFSYQRGETVYLEEDCDATLFVETWTLKHGQPFKQANNLRESYRENSFVRNLPHYRKPKGGQ